MRRAAKVLYWLMAIGLAATVALSATWGAFVRPGIAPAALVAPDTTPESAAGRQCALDLRTLHGKLVERAGRTFVGDGGPSPDMLADWAEWSIGWRQELQALRTTCRLGDSVAMEPVARLGEHLERLHLAYTTALNGFSDVGRKQLVETRHAFEALGLDKPGLTPP